MVIVIEVIINKDVNVVDFLFIFPLYSYRSGDKKVQIG